MFACSRLFLLAVLAHFHCSTPPCTEPERVPDRWFRAQTRRGAGSLRGPPSVLPAAGRHADRRSRQWRSSIRTTALDPAMKAEDWQSSSPKSRIGRIGGLAASSLSIHLARRAIRGGTEMSVRNLLLLITCWQRRAITGEGYGWRSRRGADRSGAGVDYYARDGDNHVRDVVETAVRRETGSVVRPRAAGWPHAEGRVSLRRGSRLSP
jgi:hypothetical protein